MKSVLPRWHRGGEGGQGCHPGPTAGRPDRRTDGLDAGLGGCMHAWMEKISRVATLGAERQCRESGREEGRVKELVLLIWRKQY